MGLIRRKKLIAVVRNVPSARVERATCRLGGDRSIHLSYEDENARHFKRIGLFRQMVLSSIMIKKRFGGWR